MANENFIDYVKIYTRSGKGGAGSAHFRREKFAPKGGPDGGDGGRGGHIIIQGNENKWTLLHLKYKKHIRAGHGQPGGGSHKSGADGEDVVLDVPPGTLAKDAETGEVLAEINKDGDRTILISGGRGGLGNSHFKSSTNQAPRYAQPGEPALERTIILELKLLADVGLVGFPNAGKSTLLSVISAAEPKIANYPFTTLTPQLGMISYRDGQSFVMADIPGIIEGASEGKGLGIRFLRHIERNAVLLLVIPSDADDINEEYRILLNELEAYNPELLHKPRLVAISKADLIDQELQGLIAENLTIDAPYLFFSAVAQTGLTELKDQLWKMMNRPVGKPEAMEEE
ncbi:GTPase ObgE [Membranicola marinus]|uniref:GTPase Obg n=1 Tax=Membranihabitans marinus TaxID=1227546 RepID=A0A953LAL3_9BACT|nr:GTPase ObgE [Membranihabitans marinus]MBY5957701.1 GTPase ObgE [Membranihabitans marinus]